ncbi:hypothetical protein BW247_11695 [Acidihalobacter ferrooxydans]|uniref:DUF445 domain-containing protein n=1 Tax=Acidihalobacter ferrooxydans TaxID=1765967 RepID=A0A1P8ULI6_9GAMM|nr:hypothetical protein BW247_11695 [Acidihalobacter ferrooxydans]
MANKRRRLRRLRIGALLLLGLAVAGMLVSAAFGGTGAWAWSMAFCEAAAVGALADWFAVTALFRRPLGLPIPHTDVLARRKAQIGDGLAGFVSDHFLRPELLAAKLREQDFVRRFAARMSQPEDARRVAGRVRGYALELFDTVVGSQLEALIAGVLRRALERLDVSRLSGNWLDLLTRDDRHHAALDEFLLWLADLLGDEAVQDRIFRSIVVGIENKSGWWKALNTVGLADLVSGEITRSLPAMIASLQDSLRDPAHPNRAAFDAWLSDAIERLQHDPLTQAWLNERVRGFTDSAEFRTYLTGVGRDARDWLRADLAREDSVLAGWLATGLTGFAVRLQADAALREELEGQIERLAVALAPAVDGFIHRHIRQTVRKWDERDLIAELELEIGSDLQYIRFNGTLVGGLIGLLLHALVVFVPPWFG